MCVCILVVVDIYVYMSACEGVFFTMYGWEQLQFVPCTQHTNIHIYMHTQFDAGNLQRSVIMRFSDIESKRQLLGKHVIEESTIEIKFQVVC